MEIFYVVLTTALVEGYKWSINKIGKEATKWSIYLGVLILSFLWTYLKQANILTEDFIVQVLQYGGASIALYEVLIKWLIKQNVVDKF